MPPFLLLLGCSTDGTLERRFAAQDARLAEQAARLAEQDGRLGEQAARIQAQDARITELTARVEELSKMAAPNRGTLSVDEDGRVTTTLVTTEAVACAKAELGGIVTMQYAHEAAFDRYGDSFEGIGWRPTNQRDCAANVAFSMGPIAMGLVPAGRVPGKVLGVAVVTRGPAAGRVFATDVHAEVYELPRVPTSGVATLVSAKEWVGGR